MSPLLRKTELPHWGGEGSWRTRVGGQELSVRFVGFAVPIRHASGLRKLQRGEEEPFILPRSASLS